jgi:hypothetical protein
VELIKHLRKLKLFYEFSSIFSGFKTLLLLYAKIINYSSNKKILIYTKRRSKVLKPEKIDENS